LAHHIKQWGLQTKSKFLTGLPVILFYLFLFYSIVLFFGVHYVMTVSVITVYFKIHHRKQHTVKSLAVVAGTCFLMMYLAFLATVNIPLCILLNMTVPFILVFVQASQFNQLGYFAGAMCFVFMELRPLEPGELKVQTIVMLYSVTVFAVGYELYNFKRKKHQNYGTVKRGLLLLSGVVRNEISGRKDEEELQELMDLLQGLYKESYQSGGVTYMVNGAGKIKYMSALLFQRAVYFLGNPYHRQEKMDKETTDFLKETAGYMEQAGKCDLLSKEERRILQTEGRRLLSCAEKREEEIYIFAQNFYLTFLMILENLDVVKEQTPQRDWKKTNMTLTAGQMKERLKPDAFEMRFALRLSLVLTVGFLYNELITAEHGYWLVLNAFILLRPMYEDSAYRMKTRLLGTVTGCVALHFLFFIFGGTTGHFILAGLMVVGMYTEIPGTWIHAFFVTCFALTMTTLALPQQLAMGLRLFYVAAAVVLVLLVNQFCFPTSLKSQFRYNLQMIFHMHHLSLRMMMASLKEPVAYGDICEAQIHYHLVNEQIQEYIPKISDKEEQNFFRTVIELSWYMVSEGEQMLFLINNRSMDLSKTAQIENYLIYTDYMLNEIQHMMHIKTDQRIRKKEPVLGEYKRTMEDVPRLSMLMERYGRRISRLYQVVLLHRQKPLDRS
jgi:hypothetical protein